MKDPFNPGFTTFLEARYADLVGNPAESGASPLNDLLLDRYGREVKVETLEPWLVEHSFLGRKIANRRADQSIYRLPAILLVYHLASTSPHGTRHDSPLSDPDLAMIYSDVGESLDG